MKVCNDIELLSNYIARSGAEVKQNSNSSFFFVPFFTNISKKEFNNSAVISSACCSINNISKTFPFCNMQNNSSISHLLENITGVPGTDYMFKFNRIAKEIGNTKDLKIDYSYIQNNFKEFLK